MDAKYFWIMVAIAFAVGLISRYVYDKFYVDYRFYKKVLRKRWIYLVILWTDLFLTFAIIGLALLFPGWWLCIFGGVWLGTMGELIPLYHIKSVNRLSYDYMYEVYIKNARHWEKNMNAQKKKKAK
ncbi:MAG: hypothetical protein IKK06_06870 [Clostridia bacterium]|nr:hypothetical protein [Clostridia bacterium]